MRQFKCLSAFFGAVLLTAVLGCAATSTQQGPGEYFDDTAITTKVRTALIQAPGLKSTEIHVETFRGVVQLSGFVSSQSDIAQAVQATEGVGGVKSIKNDMRLR